MAWTWQTYLFLRLIFPLNCTLEVLFMIHVNSCMANSLLLIYISRDGNVAGRGGAGTNILKKRIRGAGRVRVRLFFFFFNLTYKISVA